MVGFGLVVGGDLEGECFVVVEGWVVVEFEVGNVYYLEFYC